MIPEFEYAFYVWTSYGIFAAVMLWQFVQPIVQRRRILAELREESALRTGSYNDPHS